MSKIESLDKFICDCIAIGDWGYAEELKSYKPYIELAELYVSHHEELLKSGIGVKIDSLINKIKEQGDGNN